MRTMVLAAAALVLAGCGEAETTAAPTAGATPKSAPRIVTEAEKAALLAALPAPYDAGDLENGRRAFARCRSCHTITEGGPNMTGPNLWGLFGRAAGEHPGYTYSRAVEAADFHWDAGRLDQWLQDPRGYLPGNKMTFPGLPDATDRRDLIAFLKVETGYAPTAGEHDEAGETDEHERDEHRSGA